MKHLSPTARPAWADMADRVIDVSDAWQEAADPQNEYGEVCEAYLRQTEADCVDEHGRCFTGADFELIGISVQEGYGNGVTYYDRCMAIAFLGTDTVWAIEVHEMEAAA
jgi:hypothetical protein